MGVPVTLVDSEAVVGFNRMRMQTLLGNGKKREGVRFGLKITDIPKSSGVPVGAVSPGLSGEKAGLKEGDIITEINTNHVGKVADAEKALSGIKSGDIVTIGFTRNGKNRKFEIVV